MGGNNFGIREKPGISSERCLVVKTYAKGEGVIRPVQVQNQES